jgi:hypothetical protein
MLRTYTHHHPVVIPVHIARWWDPYEWDRPTQPVLLGIPRRNGISRLHGPSLHRELIPAFINKARTSITPTLIRSRSILETPRCNAPFSATAYLDQ